MTRSVGSKEFDQGVRLDRVTAEKTSDELTRFIAITKPFRVVQGNADARLAIRAARAAGFDDATMHRLAKLAAAGEALPLWQPCLMDDIRKELDDPRMLRLEDRGFIDVLTASLGAKQADIVSGASPKKGAAAATGPSQSDIDYRRGQAAFSALRAAGFTPSEIGYAVCHLSPSIRQFGPDHRAIVTILTLTHAVDWGTFLPAIKKAISSPTTLDALIAPKSVRAENDHFQITWKPHAPFPVKK